MNNYLFMQKYAISFFSIIIFILFTSPIATIAAETTVKLTADPSIVPTSNEIVTFGLPIKEGLIFSTDQLKVTINGIEQAINIKPGLRWHYTDNSLRSVTIQLQNINMTNGEVELVISNQGRNKDNDLQEIDHSFGWTKAGANKNYLPFPRVFALHELGYLRHSGLTPPYSISKTNDIFTNFQSIQFDTWAGNLDYSTSSNANWLFDRATAMFKAYMGTGKIKFLKEAFLSKQFYFSYIRNDGISPKPSGGDGCWTYGETACADGKYIQTQSAKLALALFGDNSQWDNDLIYKMAIQADLGWNQYNTRDMYNSETDGFTERAAGLVGLNELNAYEITGNKELLSRINQRIASLKDMQQSVKLWDKENGWIPKSGAFTHSYSVHEGDSKPQTTLTGNSNDRVFSPWMSENIADFMWQTYYFTKHKDIPEMVRLLGRAIEQYGFTSTYNSEAYTRKSAFTGYYKTQKCNTKPEATELLYFSSAYASHDTNGITHDEWWRWYTDNHLIELVLPLSLAYLADPDNNQKIKYHSRINKIISGWINENCAANVFDNVYRLWNWQHRSNSIRTWQLIAGDIELEASTKLEETTDDFFVNNNTQESNSVSTADNSNLTTLADLYFKGWIFISDDSTCSASKSWHYQCNNTKWVAASKLSQHLFIAGCKQSDGNSCANTGTNRSWLNRSSLNTNSIIKLCDIKVSGTKRSDCTLSGGTEKFIHYSKLSPSKRSLKR